MPSERPNSSSSRNVSSLRIAAISKKASAPAARVSHTCHGSMMKSLRKTGICTALRAVFKSASEPEKNSSSVSTESAAAPASSSFGARSAGA